MSDNDRIEPRTTALHEAERPTGSHDESQEVERMRLEDETRHVLAHDPGAPIDRLDEPLHEELMEEIQSRQLRG